MKNFKMKTLLLTAILGLAIGGLAGCDKNSQQSSHPSQSESGPSGEVANEYDILIDSRITHGTVTASKAKAKAGEIITVTATPETGYSLKENTLKVNDTLIVNNQFVMPEANAQITAQFELLSFTVTVSQNITHGTVTVDKATAAVGDVVSVTVSPEYGYSLVAGSLKANEVEIQNNSFTMPAANVVVTAQFAEDTNLVLGPVTVEDTTYVLTSGFQETSGQNKAETITHGQQYAFFKNINVENVMVTTKVTAVSKKSDEAHPRFGLAAVDTKNNRGLVFNIDGGSDLTGREARVETGLYNPAGWIDGEWSWGEYVMGNIPTASAYTGQSTVKLSFIKYGGVFYFYVDEQLMGISSIGSFAASDKVIVGLVTFETIAKFSDYSVSTVESEIVAKLPSGATGLTGSVAFADGLVTKSVVGSGTYAGKEVTFYGKAEANGLHLAAKAVHSLYINNAENWWLNTNFEFFLDGGNQFYVSAKQGLFTRGCAAVINSSRDTNTNLYTTIIEAFVPYALVPGYQQGEKIYAGFAWKTVGDQINNTNNEQNEYWLVKGHEANQKSQQFVVTSMGIQEPQLPTIFGNINIENVAASTTARFDLTHDGEDGNSYVVTTHDGNTYEQQYAFFKNVVSENVMVTAEVNVISKKSGEDHPRFGLAMVSQQGRAFIYNIDGGSSLTGKEVRVESGKWNGSWMGDPWSWGEHGMGDMPSSASYTGNSAVKFTLIKYNGVIYFFINDLAMGSKAINGFGPSDKVGVALSTFESESKFTNYSATTDVNAIKEYLGINGSASWAEGLSTVGVVGTGTYEGKSVEFSAKLTEKGLYLKATAHHALYVTNASNWWENTNFELFVSGNHQFWANAQGGLKTSDKAIAVIDHSGTEGSYITTIEIFISREFLQSYISNNAITVGFAWKTPGDVINNGNDGESEYWLVAGHPASDGSKQFTVTSNGIQLS